MARYRVKRVVRRSTECYVICDVGSDPCICGYIDTEIPLSDFATLQQGEWIITAPAIMARVVIDRVPELERDLCIEGTEDRYSSHELWRAVHGWEP